MSGLRTVEDEEYCGGGADGKCVQRVYPYSCVHVQKCRGVVQTTGHLTSGSQLICWRPLSVMSVRWEDERCSSRPKLLFPYLPAPRVLLLNTRNSRQSTWSPSCPGHIRTLSSALSSVWMYFGRLIIKGVPLMIFPPAGLLHSVSLRVCVGGKGATVCSSHANALD